MARKPLAATGSGLCSVFAADVAGSEYFLGRASVWDFAESSVS